LTSLLHHASTIEVAQAQKLAKDLYGVVGSAKQLPSERDQNFLITAIGRERFVLKIANALERRALLEAQNDVMRYLGTRIDFSPTVRATESGDVITQVDTETASHFVRLVTFIPGEPLAYSPQSPQLLFDVGSKLAELTNALADFDNEEFHRDFHWDLANGLKVIREYESLVTDPQLRVNLAKCARLFEHVRPRVGKLRRSVIHGDANDHNLIIEHERLVGLIDFGDMVYSYTVGELAIGLAYVLLDKPDAIAIARAVVAGYASRRSLNDDEIQSIWPLILRRLCMSVCLAAFQQKQKPDNQYLDISQRSIRDALQLLLAIDPNSATDLFYSQFKP
jgi:Ser/Thr protein kinase RdoA (MazF antagonist)